MINPSDRYNRFFQALDYLAIGIHEIGSVSECRMERLVNHGMSGLPAFLTLEGGLNSGFMIAHCTAAALGEYCLSKNDLAILRIQFRKIKFSVIHHPWIVFPPVLVKKIMYPWVDGLLVKH